MIAYRHRRLDTDEVFYIGIGSRAYTKRRSKEKVKNKPVEIFVLVEMAIENQQEVTSGNIVRW